MEYWVKELAHYVAAVCELICIFVLAMGAVKAIWRLAINWRIYDDQDVKQQIWIRFAGSIILALEFALAADIAGTAVSPSWDEIGQLAAIAAIRTFLNIFLEKDFESAREKGAEARARRKEKAEA
jgi:uncharacterized membrane protein